MIIVVGGLLALLAAVPGPGTPRMGSAEVAVGALLAGSLAASIWDHLNLFFLTAGLGMALLIALLAYGKRSTNSVAWVDRDHDRVGLGSPAVIAFALVLWLLLRNLTVMPDAPRVILAGASSLGLVVVALLLERARCRLDPRNAVRILSMYGSLSVIAGNLAGEIWTPCRADKCSVAGQLLRTVFRSENSVSNWAGLAIAFELTTRVTGVRWLRLGILVAVLLMSGGRGAVLALVLAIAAAAALAFRTRAIDASFLPTRRRSLLLVGGVTAVAVAVGLTAARTSFAGRGRLWRVALDNVGLASPVGRGTVVWDTLTEGDPVQLSIHSSYLWMVFGGGLTALFLYGLLLISLVRRCSASTQPQLVRRLVPITYVLFGGLYGVVWNPATLDEFSVLMLIVLTYGVRQPAPVVRGLSASHQPQRLAW